LTTRSTFIRPPHRLFHTEDPIALRVESRRVLCSKTDSSSQQLIEGRLSLQRIGMSRSDELMTRSVLAYAIEARTRLCSPSLWPKDDSPTKFLNVQTYYSKMGITVASCHRDPRLHFRTSSNRNRLARREAPCQCSCRA